MSLFRTITVTQPLGTTAKPTLALVLRGAKRSVLGDRVYDYRPANSWSSPSTCR